jgi:hypothetical protein
VGQDLLLFKARPHVRELLPARLDLCLDVFNSLGGLCHAAITVGLSLGSPCNDGCGGSADGDASRAPRTSPLWIILRIALAREDFARVIGRQA